MISGITWQRVCSPLESTYAPSLADWAIEIPARPSLSIRTLFQKRTMKQEMLGRIFEEASLSTPGPQAALEPG
jgi:hypothetical protein